MTPEPLRIVFFGTPAFAVPSLRALLESRHPVVAVVSQPDRPKGRGQKLLPTPTKELALSRSVPLLQPLKLRDEAFLRAVENARPDLGIVAAYGRILPEGLLQIPRLGMINVHASLLPVRGAAVHRAVIGGSRRQERDDHARRGGARRRADVRIRARGRRSGDTSVEVERISRGSGRISCSDRRGAGGGRAVSAGRANATYARGHQREGMIDWTLPAAGSQPRARLQPWPLVGVVRRRSRAHRRTPCDAGTSAAPSVTLTAMRLGRGRRGRIIHILELQPEGRRAMTARGSWPVTRSTRHAAAPRSKARQAAYVPCDGLVGRADLPAALHTSAPPADGAISASLPRSPPARCGGGRLRSDRQHVRRRRWRGWMPK